MEGSEAGMPLFSQRLVGPQDLVDLGRLQQAPCQSHHVVAAASHRASRVATWQSRHIVPVRVAPRQPCRSALATPRQPCRCGCCGAARREKAPHLPLALRPASPPPQPAADEPVDRHRPGGLRREALHRRPPPRRRLQVLRRRLLPASAARRIHQSPPPPPRRGRGSAAAVEGCYVLHARTAAVCV